LSTAKSEKKNTPVYANMLDAAVHPERTPSEHAARVIAGWTYREDLRRTPAVRATLSRELEADAPGL
jgi:hypothetical protein